MAARSHPGAVVVPVGTDHDDATVRRAIEVADEEGLQLVILDRSVEGVLSSPPYDDLRGDDEFRPTPDETISAETARREGHNELAAHIESATEAGVVAGGWFPTKDGIAGIEAAIDRFDASVIVVPASMREPSIGERFRGVTMDGLEKLGARVVVAE